MKYIVKEVYFKNGKPIEVKGKIIHVDALQFLQDPYIDANFVAWCLIEVEDK